MDFQKDVNTRGKRAADAEPATSTEFPWMVIITLVEKFELFVDRVKTLLTSVI